MLQVYQAIADLAVDGICSKTQTEIAARAGISPRHCYEVIRRLVEVGSISVLPSRRHHGAGSRLVYRVEKLMDSQGLLVEWGEALPIGRLMDSQSLPVEKLMDSQSLPVATNGLSESTSQKNGAHDHDMNDMKEILSELNFINAKNRAACAKLVDLPTARRWRQLWEYCEANDAWGEYGVKTNGVGYIVRLIKNQDPVPAPVQSPLPAGSLDLSQPFISRGMTRAEIEAAHSVNGATLGDDGIWR